MNRRSPVILFLTIAIAFNCQFPLTAIAQDTNQPGDRSQLKTANVNEIKIFIYSWFALLDRQVSEISLFKFLDFDNLTMEVPEATISDRQDFSNWYLELQRDIETNTYDVEQLEVTPRGEGFDVRLRVNWQAETRNGGTLERAYQQQWKIITDERRRLLIQEYLSKEI